MFIFICWKQFGFLMYQVLFFNCLSTILNRSFQHEFIYKFLFWNHFVWFKTLFTDGNLICIPADRDDETAGKTNDKASTSGVKNLIDAFNAADDEPMEHMPDYEQFVPGKILVIFHYFFNYLPYIFYLYFLLNPDVDDDGDDVLGKCVIRVILLSLVLNI